MNADDTITWQHESAETRGPRQMTLSNESFRAISRSAVTDESVPIKVLGDAKCSTREMKEMMLGECSSQNRFGACVWPCSRQIIEAQQDHPKSRSLDGSKH